MRAARVNSLTDGAQRTAGDFLHLGQDAAVDLAADQHFPGRRLKRVGIRDVRGGCKIKALPKAIKAVQVIRFQSLPQNVIETRHKVLRKGGKRGRLHVIVCFVNPGTILTGEDHEVQIQVVKRGFGDIILKIGVIAPQDKEIGIIPVAPVIRVGGILVQLLPDIGGQAFPCRADLGFFQHIDEILKKHAEGQIHQHNRREHDGDDPEGYFRAKLHSHFSVE